MITSQSTDSIKATCYMRSEMTCDDVVPQASAGDRIGEQQERFQTPSVELLEREEKKPDLIYSFNT